MPAEHLAVQFSSDTSQELVKTLPGKEHAVKPVLTSHKSGPQDPDPSALATTDLRLPPSLMTPYNSSWDTEDTMIVRIILLESQGNSPGGEIHMVARVMEAGTELPCPLQVPTFPAS